jgi:hypothetical protein
MFAIIVILSGSKPTKWTLLLRLQRDFARAINLYEMHRHVQRLVPTELLWVPVFLKLHREGYRAAEIGHVVIENALVRLACCQRTYGADRKIFIYPIVRGKRENFADVIATSLVILPPHQRTNGVDKQGTSQSCRITNINCIIASLR